jgi:hypothetical protein
VEPDEGVSGDDGELGGQGLPGCGGQGDCDVSPGDGEDVFGDGDEGGRVTGGGTFLSWRP